MSSYSCNYYSCSTCAGGDYACVWDNTYNECVNYYNDGYPNDYTSYTSHCDDTCCYDYSSCKNCANDNNYCDGYCVWDNNNNECVNYWAENVYDYTSSSYNCDDDSSASFSGYLAVFIIIGLCVFFGVIAFVWYQQKKKRQMINNNGVTPARNVNIVTPAAPVQTEGGSYAPVANPSNIKYVDQNGNPVAPPTVGGNIKYVDQNGIKIYIFCHFSFFFYHSYTHFFRKSSATSNTRR